jgi:hypothetical protein
MARFQSEDTQAVASIEHKRHDLAQALKLAPSLVAPLEQEIEACETALEKARAAAESFDAETVEAARATLIRQAALTAKNTSEAVDRETVEKLVSDVEVATQVEAARKRRVESSHSVATSQYFRVSKGIQARKAAVEYAERLAGETLDRDPGRNEAPKDPAVIAWCRLTMPVEGRAFYMKGYAYRADHPSYDLPRPVEEYDEACRSFFASVDARRATMARELEALSSVAVSP